MKYFQIIILFTLIVSNVYSQEKLNIDLEFNINPSFTGTQGYEILHVYVLCKKEKGCIEIAKRNAVQAILFFGVLGSGSIEPLIEKTQLSDDQIIFLNNFFKEQYLNYVSIANDGSILPGDFIKIRNRIKIGYMISVNKVALRRYLEENKIIRKLGL